MLKKIAMIAMGLFVLACGSETKNGKTAEVVGFWQITKVEMEGREMTPVAKWTRIHEDGSYTSGNGWLQHSKGGWSYEDQKFLPTETYGIKDPFGAFEVSREGQIMYWEREEDGMRVKVTLKPIQQLPSSVTNEIIGLWGLEGEQGNESAGHRKHVYFGWDRVYRAQNAQGQKETGYWHIHGHRPEVTLLPHAADEAPESWMAAVKAGVLTLRGNSEGNQGEVVSYRRLDSFPN